MAAIWRPDVFSPGAGGETEGRQGGTQSYSSKITPREYRLTDFTVDWTQATSILVTSTFLFFFWHQSYIIMVVDISSLIRLRTGPSRFVYPTKDSLSHFSLVPADKLVYSMPTACASVWSHYQITLVEASLISCIGLIISVTRKRCFIHIRLIMNYWSEE